MAIILALILTTATAPAPQILPVSREIDEEYGRMHVTWANNRLTPYKHIHAVKQAHVTQAETQPSLPVEIFHVMELPIVVADPVLARTAPRIQLILARTEGFS